MIPRLAKTSTLLGRSIVKGCSSLEPALTALMEVRESCRKIHEGRDSATHAQFSELRSTASQRMTCSWAIKMESLLLGIS